MPRLLAQLPPFLDEILTRWNSFDLIPNRLSASHIYRRARRTLASIIALHPLETFTHWTDFTRPRVAAFTALKQRLGNGPEAIRKDLQALRSFFRFAEAEKLFGPQISHQLRGLSPIIRYVEPTALTPDQETALLQRARWCHRDNPSVPAKDWAPGAFHLACLLGLRQALRPSEILGLTWDELSINDPPSIQLRPNALRRLKNSRAITPLQLCPDVAEALKTFQDRQTKSDSAELEYVFANAQPRRPDWFDLWRTLAAELGVPGLNAYWLRRTCCTRLVDAGMDLQGLLSFMRHSDVHTSQRYYFARSQGVPISYETGRKMHLPASY